MLVVCVLLTSGGTTVFITYSLVHKPEAYTIRNTIRSILFENSTHSSIDKMSFSMFESLRFVKRVPTCRSITVSDQNLRSRRKKSKVVLSENLKNVPNKQDQKPNQKPIFSSQ